MAEGTSEIATLDATVDAANVDTGAVVDAQESPELIETEQTSEQTEHQDQQASESDGDGRTLPLPFKEWLKQLGTTNPKLAKSLRTNFFAAQQLRTEVPGGLPEVRKMREFIDTVGGEDGWQAISNERAEWNQLDEQYTNGDPKFIDSIAAESPEAFSKLAPHVLSKFAQLDPEGYQHSLAGIVLNTLTQGPLSRIYDLLAANPDTKAVAQELANWYRGIEDTARKTPERKSNPEAERLRQDREKFESERATAFSGEVTAAGQKLVESAISRELSREFQKIGRNLDQYRQSSPEAYKRLLKNCDDTVASMLDQKFKESYGAALGARDRARALRMIEGKLRDLAPEAVRRTVREFSAIGLGGAKRQPVAVPQNGASNGNGKPISLAKAPQPSDIDWSRSKSSDVLSGKAYLKGKKELYQWD